VQHAEESDGGGTLHNYIRIKRVSDRWL